MLNSTTPDLNFLLNSFPQSLSPLITYKSLTHKRPRNFKPLAIITPSSRSQPSPPQQPYQPFRPPPSPLPAKYRNLDAPARIDILANRLGLWHEYTPLISSLLQEGFSPPSLEEATGISGVEQNRLIVAAQVRDSLIQSNTDSEILAAFDTSGSELLYEIRLLNVSQRASAARHIVEKNFDAKAAQELARAMKDYPKRKGDKSWESFDYTIPGDCLAFMYLRQSREYQKSSNERISTLEKSLEAVESESAKEAVGREMDSVEKGKEEEETVGEVKIPVVRMNMGEVAEAKSVVLLPVCKGREEVSEAPWECKSGGEFGVVEAEKGWGRWVAVPRWEPLIGAGGGVVAVLFENSEVLTWKMKNMDAREGILVVIDRERRGVEIEDGFYVVDRNDDGLKVERGRRLKEMGLEESLGTVILVLRPPREEGDQIRDGEWD